MAARGRAVGVLLVVAVVLTCGAGGAPAQSGRASAATPHLYWVPPNSSGPIVEANLNGTGARPIVKRRTSGGPMAVGGGHLYWFAEGIVEANLNGTGAKTIVRTPMSMRGGVEVVNGIAVGNGHLYWTDHHLPPPPTSPNSRSSGTIVEANLNGTRAKTIARIQGTPSGVAVGGGHLYWSVEEGAIVEANMDGTSARTIASGQSDPWVLALGGGHLYWVTGNMIVEANLNGSGAKTIATRRGLLGPLAVGGGHLYWSEGNGTVEANLNGTGAKTIVRRGNLRAVGP